MLGGSESGVPFVRRGERNGGRVGRPGDPLPQAGTQRGNTYPALGPRTGIGPVGQADRCTVGPPPEAVQGVHVLDRGADHFEVYCHCLEQKSDWVVRAKSLHRKMLDPTGRGVTVAEYLETLPVAGTFQLKP